MLERLRVCAVLALMLSVAPPLVAGATPAPSRAIDDDGPQLYAMLAAALPAGTHRAAPRLASVSVDSAGEATVVFAIRGEGDDAEATRAGALADTLTVLRTVYQSPAAERVTTLSVLGTFPFQGTKGKSVREGVVLRAVLSADRAAPLSWEQLTPAGLASVLDVWWLQDAFANAFGNLDDERKVQAEQPSPAPEVESDAPLDLAKIHSRLDVSLAHIVEARSALAEGDVRIARSQFKQFFDLWDQIDNEGIAKLYPVQYEQLDADLERAEIALLHRQPEDVMAASSALQNVAAGLADISRDLGGRIGMGVP